MKTNTHIILHILIFAIVLIIISVVAVLKVDTAHGLEMPQKATENTFYDRMVAEGKLNANIAETANKAEIEDNQKLKEISQEKMLEQTAPNLEGLEEPHRSRKIRKWACHIAFQELRPNGAGATPVEHCATMATLVYAMESGYGKSPRCVNDLNCFGMKGNGIDTPAGFLRFTNHIDDDLYFARKFFTWHYKKSVGTFVRNWSMTDQGVYINFVTKRYQGVFDYFIVN